MKKEYRGLLEMLGATFIWGSTPIVGLLSHLPSPVFVFFRVLFAFPFVLFFALKQANLKELLLPKPFWAIFLSGVMLGLNWIFFFWALQITDVAIVVIIYYMGPILSLFLAIFFLKEPFYWNIGVALVLALIGVFISTHSSWHFDRGVIIALLASISYGLLGFFSKLATRHHKSIVVTNYQIFISIFLTLPFLFLQEWHFSLQTLFIVIIAGVVHTALALFLWYDALHYISVSLAAILQYLDIFFTIALAFLILGQVPTLFEVIGACCIALAGIIASLKSFN